MSRGPYRLQTKDMDAGERARWFRDQGALTKRLCTKEGPYVNAKVRTATGFSADKRRRTVLAPNWYNQAHLARNEWGIA